MFTETSILIKYFLMLKRILKNISRLVKMRISSFMHGINVYRLGLISRNPNSAWTSVSNLRLTSEEAIHKFIYRVSGYSCRACPSSAKQRYQLTFASCGTKSVNVNCTITCIRICTVQTLTLDAFKTFGWKCSTCLFIS